MSTKDHRARSKSPATARSIDPCVADAGDLQNDVAPNGSVALADSMIGQGCPVKSVAGSRRGAPPRSAFAEFRFPAEVIVVAVRWYLRYGLSYRDAS
jgi:hypothetical protein